MFAFQHFAGLDEATAARMCQNPELVRKMRRELDEARDRSGTPTVPTDTLTASLDEAMKKFEEEKGKSIQRNPPLTPRYMLLEAARQARAQLLAPRGPNQVRTLQSFTGIPKSFSSTPLSQLRFSESVRLHTRSELIQDDDSCLQGFVTPKSSQGSLSPRSNHQSAL